MNATSFFCKVVDYGKYLLLYFSISILCGAIDHNFPPRIIRVPWASSESKRPEKAANGFVFLFVSRGSNLLKTGAKNFIKGVIVEIIREY
jgi:hypothetical protein